MIRFGFDYVTITMFVFTIEAKTKTNYLYVIRAIKYDLHLFEMIKKTNSNSIPSKKFKCNRQGLVEEVNK